ncbi:MAG: sigma-70 family RNA polymerase sigma factor [Saprospiraceae bacterium]|nr:sigma-70 family RNA polymerase sigma factor [Saprospiraceae bacterium]
MATLTYKANNAQNRIFEQEFMPLLDAVYAFSYRLTGDRSQAEDLAQETFLKAWRFIERYTADTNAKAWLFRICRNAFINEWRSRKTQPRTRDIDDPGVRLLPVAESPRNDRMGDEVMQAINLLSPNFRTVVLLDLEDFTYEEIAAILDIPIGTVRSRLHRARNVLAKQLEVYGRSKGYNVQDNEGNVGADIVAPDAS